MSGVWKLREITNQTSLVFCVLCLVLDVRRCWWWCVVSVGGCGVAVSVLFVVGWWWLCGLWIAWSGAPWWRRDRRISDLQIVGLLENQIVGSLENQMNLFVFAVHRIGAILTHSRKARHCERNTERTNRLIWRLDISSNQGHVTCFRTRVCGFERLLICLVIALEEIIVFLIFILGIGILEAVICTQILNVIVNEWRIKVSHV